LYWAPQTSNPVVIKKLLAVGADCNVKDKKGKITLHDAIKLRHQCTFFLLIESGTAIQVKNLNRKTPLDLAKAKFKKEVITHLKEKIKKWQEITEKSLEINTKTLNIQENFKMLLQSFESIEEEPNNSNNTPNKNVASLKKENITEKNDSNHNDNDNDKNNLGLAS